MGAGSLPPLAPALGLIGVGLIFHSLYFWHWIVLSLSRWTSTCLRGRCHPRSS